MWRLLDADLCAVLTRADCFLMLATWREKENNDRTFVHSCAQPLLASFCHTNLKEIIILLFLLVCQFPNKPLSGPTKTEKNKNPQKTVSVDWMMPTIQIVLVQQKGEHAGTTVNVACQTLGQT